jgi:hypothetical protein
MQQARQQSIPTRNQRTQHSVTQITYVNAFRNL